eukprot:TRINITY_DN40360_c0_g1_i1.p1 TRINITY_DN40360_c0_g1~~TRINITY_DN40360_c0_g1_i1.p1  ORF type:complete len:681 (+),score=157.45 TRINITY_DN40360_c0_g1_i1:42-2045(+)
MPAALDDAHVVLLALLRYLHTAEQGSTIRTMVAEVQSQLKHASAATEGQRVAVTVCVDVALAACIEPHLAWVAMTSPAKVSRALFDAVHLITSRYYSFPVSTTYLRPCLTFARLPGQRTLGASEVGQAVAVAGRYRLYYKQDAAALRWQPPQVLRFQGTVCAVHLRRTADGCLEAHTCDVMSVPAPVASRGARRTVQISLQGMPPSDQPRIGESLDLVGIRRQPSGPMAGDRVAGPIEMAVLACRRLARVAWPVSAPVKVEAGGEEDRLVGDWQQLAAGINDFAAWLSDGEAECGSLFGARAAVLVSAASVKATGSDGATPVHTLIITHRDVAAELLSYAAGHASNADVHSPTRPLAPVSRPSQWTNRERGYSVTAGSLSIAHEGILLVPCADLLRRREAEALAEALRRRCTLTRVGAEQRYAAPCCCAVLSAADPHTEVPDPSPDGPPDSTKKAELWLQRYVDVHPDIVRASDLVVLDRGPMHGAEEEVEHLVRQMDTVLHAYDETDDEFPSAASPPLHRTLQRLLWSGGSRSPPVSAAAGRMLREYYVECRRRRDDAAVSVSLLHSLLRCAASAALLHGAGDVRAAHALLAIALVEHSLAAKTGHALLPADDLLLCGGSDSVSARTDAVLRWRDAVARWSAPSRTHHPQPHLPFDPDDIDIGGTW